MIAADLLVGNTSAIADLRNFFLSNLTAFPQVGGIGGTMYRFSAATIVGKQDRTNGDRWHSPCRHGAVALMISTGRRFGLGGLAGRYANHGSGIRFYRAHLQG